MKTIKNHNESWLLVPNYFKIGQGNQWFPSVSTTCDFHISHDAVNLWCTSKFVETFYLEKTLQYGLRSICFNGAKIWDSIPPELREASSVRIFKNNLKNLFFDCYFSEYIRRLQGLYSVWRHYLLALPLGVPWWGFPRLCTFCWGTKKMKESRLLLSWCLGGELGAAVGLLGVGVVVCLCSGCGLSDL